MTRIEAPRHPRNRVVHGVSIGILVLDTGFQRFPGDVGNAETFAFPVQYAVVRGATPKRVLSQNADGLFETFLAAAEDLVALGVDGIATSCGFLAVLQKEFAARCTVPVATSSLLQIPMLQALLPAGQTVGVLTADKAALTPAHFAGAGVGWDVPTRGLDLEGRFKAQSRANAAIVDYHSNEAEVLALARQLVEDHPEVGAIVSECTNFAAYSAAIQAATGRPVYDVITLINWFHAGLRPKSYPRPGPPNAAIS